MRREKTVGVSFRNRSFPAAVRQQSDEFCVISALKDSERCLAQFGWYRGESRPEDVTGVFFCCVKKIDIKDSEQNGMDRT